MSPEQQLFDVLFSVMGLVFNSVVTVMFDVILVPLLQELLSGFTGSGTTLN
ncbi:MAG TPA: hypothetical protein VNT79_15035 [Phycisphaerae bacterium]|nr:hypothetical protein [Phycisphaerae bacterium]